MSHKDIHEHAPINSILAVRTTASLQKEVEEELLIPTPEEDIAKACLECEDDDEDTEEHD